MLRLNSPHDIIKTEKKAEPSDRQMVSSESLDEAENSEDSNLIDFFLSKLNETSSFQRIRAVAKIAIIKGMDKNIHTKKNWILSALKKLEQLEISLKMQTIILGAIEVVILSRRISDLKKLNLFSKEVAENNNHSWLLNGARVVISTYYPDLNAYYLRCPSIIHKHDKNEIIHIKENVLKKEVLWLIVSYHDNLHLTLIRIQFINEKLTIHVFDSIAAMPKESGKEYDTELYKLVTAIKDEIKPPKVSIKFVSVLRQVDSTNCFSFVLFDLQLALNFFAKRQKCFLNKAEQDEKAWLYRNIKEYKTFASDFYKIAQNREDSPSEIVSTWKTRITSKKNTYGNPEALWTSARALTFLIQKEIIHFTPANYHEDGESEEDVPKRCYSTL